MRDQYAMNYSTLPEPQDLKALPAFFFWPAWSAVTNRPGATGLSYTSNWPHEPLVGNTLASSGADLVSRPYHPPDRCHRRL